MGAWPSAERINHKENLKSGGPVCGLRCRSSSALPRRPSPSRSRPAQGAASTRHCRPSGPVASQRKARSSSRHCPLASSALVSPSAASPSPNPACPTALIRSRTGQRGSQRLRSQAMAGEPSASTPAKTSWRSRKELSPPGCRNRTLSRPYICWSSRSRRQLAGGGTGPVPEGVTTLQRRRVLSQRPKSSPGRSWAPRGAQRTPRASSRISPARDDGPGRSFNSPSRRRRCPGN